MDEKYSNDVRIAFIDKERADEALMQELYQVLAAGFNGESPWTVQHLRETVASESSIILAATLAEEKVGVIVASETAFSLDIYLVVVAEKHKQKYIGTQLFNALIAYAKEQTIEAIVLETRVSNKPAIALYERVGFEKVGERKAYYSRPIEDALVMKYELGKEK
jgi:ribosomal-protein-alanine N-acetyltransferase